MADTNETEYPPEATIGDQGLRAAGKRDWPSLRLPLPPENLHRRIARKAYELYLLRGKTPGRALDDWLEAERMFVPEAVLRQKRTGGANA